MTETATATVPTTKTRRSQILNAVDGLIEAHDAWSDDPAAPPQPSEEFENRLRYLAAVIDAGPVPPSLLKLAQAVHNLAREWDLYEGGYWNRDKTPKSSLWREFRSVRTYRESADNVLRKRHVESVRTFREQGVQDHQIAIAYGGSRGPFMRDGIVRTDLIQREYDEPGSVIGPDWRHPDDAPAEPDTPAVPVPGYTGETQERDLNDVRPQVEALLREGQYVPAIARVHKLTEDQVRAIAADAGIEPAELPNLAAMRAPHEPLTSEQDKTLQPGRNAVGVQSDDVPEQRTAAGSAGASRGGDQSSGATDEVSQLIVDEHERNPDATASDILATLKEAGYDVTVQKVAAVLREHKKREG